METQQKQSVDCCLIISVSSNLCRTVNCQAVYIHSTFNPVASKGSASLADINLQMDSLFDLVVVVAVVVVVLFVVVAAVGFVLIFAKCCL